MKDNLVFGVDCMGGDNAPDAQVQSVIYCLKHGVNHGLNNTFFHLYGDTALIKKILEKHYFSSASIDDYNALINTRLVLHECDGYKNPNLRSKDSIKLLMRTTSMGIGLYDLRDDKIDAFITAGNTGLLSLVSSIIIGKLKGIKKIAISAIIPNINIASNSNGTVLLDVGATTKADPLNYINFAMMGIALSKALGLSQNPTVGLLNIGHETGKGLPVLHESDIMLRQQNIAYQGYVEPNIICNGLCDVIVTDGFVGNIALKSVEGVGRAIRINAQKIIQDLPWYKKMLLMPAKLVLESPIKKILKKANEKNSNGAMLLGLKKIVIKAHGNSDMHAFYNAIQTAAMLKKNHIISKLQENIYY